MPLHDHFHPPLTHHYEWENFHGDWITMIVQRLNTVHLTDDHLAKGRSHRGTEVEVDVATMERRAFNGSPFSGSGRGNGSVAVQTYSPPLPSIVGLVDLAEDDVYEVQVYSDELKLVAAIELVSPANKDRPAKRRAFVTKVAAYLARGVSVVVVDIVTSRLANPHDELVEMLHLPDSFQWLSPTHLSAVAYRMIEVETQTRLEIWPHILTLGEELPTLPLWLAADVVVPLELEATYAATCAGLKIR